MTNPEEHGPPVFDGDFEKYLRDSRISVKAYELMAEQENEGAVQSVLTGHGIAHRMAVHLPPDERDVAHKALVMATGMLGGLIVQGVYNPIALVNVMAIAAEHLIDIEEEEKRHEG